MRHLSILILVIGGLLFTSIECNDDDSFVYSDMLRHFFEFNDQPKLPNITAEEIHRRFSEISLTEALELGAKSLLSRRDAAGGELSRSPDDWFYNVSETCLNDIERLFEGLLTNESWPTSMLDATGKPGAGLKLGNINWLGNYDECLNISAPVLVDNSTRIKQFDGQYCLNSIGDIRHQNPLDPTKVIIKLGTCLPKTCDSNDTRGLVNTALSMIPGVHVTLSFFAWTQCKTPHSELKYSTAAIAVIIVLASFAVIMAIATIVDIVIEFKVDREVKLTNTRINTENGGLLDPESDTIPILAEDLRRRVVLDEKHKAIGVRLLLTFSVITNMKKLFSTQTGPEDLGVIHGVRFLSMTWVILGHTLFFEFIASAFDNTLWFYNTEIKRWAFQGIMNATFSVDSFFVLSGLLMTYLFMKELDRVGGPRKINWLMFYFHRFWRLTPVYMLVIMAHVPLSPYLGDGPMYPQNANGIDPNCPNNWWTNLLYVNNLVHSKEMCMGWSWYLANDMQFYWISPLILIPFFWHWAAGTVIVGILCMVNFLSTGLITTRDSLSGANAGDTFADMYIKPWCRIAPYVIGMLVGYVLYRTKRKVKLHWAMALLGWCIAAVCCLAPLYGNFDRYNGHPMSQATNSAYQALSRTSWAVGLCWVIFACLTGYGGLVNKILSWKALIPLSRLTYCAYLVHPIIMTVVNLSIRQPVYANDTHIIYAFLGHLAVSYMVALVTSLAFESPMMGIEKVLIRKRRPQAATTDNIKQNDQS